MNGSWKDEYFVKIREVEKITHDVKRFRVSKPEGYQFIPGEATDIVINLPDWKKRRKPFTFTGLNEWDFLEFTIKIYTNHQGFTNKLDQLQVGDELIIHDSFGEVRYHGTGTFIAGGAGVTPFIAILRQLEKEKKLKHHRLIFSNKTTSDIILKEEFEAMLHEHFINTITEKPTNEYEDSRIDGNFLQKHLSSFDDYFYLCGPRRMVKDIQNHLLHLGAKEDKVIIEQEF